MRNNIHFKIHAVYVIHCKAHPVDRDRTFDRDVARHITRRPKVLVFGWCYHGTVDETFVIMGADGTAEPRGGNVGPAVPVSQTSRVAEFNDLASVEAGLAHGDVAVLVMEPALTNIGIVLPEPGYLEGVRALTRQYDALLIIDETHTICTGPSGYTRAYGLDPDLFVVGKLVGGGVPAAAYGLSALVLGGAGIAAAKLGWLGAFGAWIGKAWKAVVAGLVAIGVGIKKLFGKITGARTDDTRPPTA